MARWVIDISVLRVMLRRHLLYPGEALTISLGRPENPDESLAQHCSLPTDTPLGNCLEGSESAVA